MQIGLTAKMEFKENSFFSDTPKLVLVGGGYARGTTYGNRTHFTPVWYLDGSYKANTW